MIRNGKTRYAGVLNIPEGQSGPVKVQHRTIAARTKINTSNMRTALFGQRVTSVTYQHDTVWHELVEYDYGLWMTDLPIEQRQTDELTMKMRGSVLVGGLGLGYAIAALSTRARVQSITVVERSEHIIALVQPHLTLHRKIPVEVVHADLFDYLKTTDRQFYWALYDIWQSDGESTFHDTVVPLRRLSEGKVRKVACWNEDIMRGQLSMGLTSRLMSLQVQNASQRVEAAGFPVDFDWKPFASGLHVDLDKLSTPRPDDEPGACYTNWSVPFWRWYRETSPEFDVARNVAYQYAMSYGTDGLARFMERWNK